MNMASRTISKFCTLFCWISISLASISVQAADDYPNRPIRLLVGSSAGASSDIYARLLAEQLGKVLGQTVIVDNRPGAGGLIGSDVVAKANPDGYTILMTSSSIHSISAALNKKAPFDYDKDFTPIIHIASAPHIFLVTKQIPVANLKECIIM
jgi:tripartite-type tricarboxylate transporter receptor subunit TctC